MNKLQSIMFGLVAISCFGAVAKTGVNETTDVKNINSTADGVGVSVVAVEDNLIPLMKALIESKELNISVTSSGDVPYSITKNGLKMGISSRKWKDREVAQFVEKYGYKPTELYFTADVIAILANDNNQTSSISLAELKTIFGCNSSPEVVRWADKNGQRGEPMVPFAIDEQLVMHREFSTWVTCSEGAFTATHFVPDQQALLSELNGDVNALGYTVYTDNMTDNKVLNVINNLGETYDVNKETIFSGRYPLASVYYMYLNLPPNREYFNEQEEFFISLALSDEQQSVLNDYGFISLPIEAVHRNRIKLGLEKPMIEGGYR
ncbi:PstS family phosphate ABC transporter substrate-binding protein [Vibrio sp. 10N.261.51.F12]|uniref:PstS family phosphate ABC transporter substrate-binding protein n=1 Tax=Vibrio sp. 10N.261.51.F12 TaxID=3229679 RepID=UPI00354C7FA3